VEEDELFEVLHREVRGHDLTIARTARQWVVRWTDRQVEGRTLTPLLEQFFGPRDELVMKLTLEALERRWASDAPLGRERTAGESPREDDD
jgi:hypothetical protein